jgi:hypothetical protein
MNFKDLRMDQARQMSDAASAFELYEQAAADARRFTGSMRWKTIGDADYLYHKRRFVEKSVGRRSAETEAVYERFYAGKADNEALLQVRAARLDEMAPVNGAMGLARAPTIVGRVMRAIAAEGILGAPMIVVGTNALYAYERAAGVLLGTDLMTTEDVDILYDNRARLRFLTASPVRSAIGILRHADKTFRPVRPNSYSAANADGFLVDIITPQLRDRIRAPKLKIGDDPDDMHAAEIEGLSWLVNSPKITQVMIDDRGFPFRMVCPDPRAFAVHKLWLAQQPNREAVKALRDRAQAEIVAKLVIEKMPHLRFDAADLKAIPKSLMESASRFTAAQPEASSRPNW